MSGSVSVLISVLNGSPYLSESIESVLVQLRDGDELIVVDDGSTDDTPSILAGLGARIRVITQPNAGSAAALNRARSLAVGDYVAFNDADDLWAPGRLDLQRATLDGSEATGAVTGLAMQFASPELSDEEIGRLVVPGEPQQGATMPCFLVRRPVLDALGPFDESLRVTFSYAWLAELRRAGVSLHVLPEIVLRRRVHLSNWSRLNREQLATESLRAMRAQIVRRRGNP